MTDAPQLANLAGWKLVLDNGTAEGESFPITYAETVIGRSETADISLDDARISRQHARLVQEGNQLLIEDLNSFNGTLVNNQPVTGRYLLTPYDVITIGPFTFNVEGPTIVGDPTTIAAAPAAAPPPPPVPTTNTSSPGMAAPPSAVYLPLPPQETGALVVSGPVAKKRNPVGLLLVAALGLGLLLAGLLVVLVVAWFLFSDSGPDDVAEVPTVRPPTVLARKGPTIIIDEVPPDGSVILADRPVTVRATATDPTGVRRLELWVNGSKYAEQISPVAPGETSLPADWEWKSNTAGTYNLEIRAYNNAGLLNVLPLVTIQVEGIPEPPTFEPTAPPTPAPTPTSPVEPATPTPSPAAPTPVGPTFTVTVPGLSVRAGPGSSYETVGTIRQGTAAEIIGQYDIGQGLWWLIRFDQAPEGEGWVSGSPVFGVATNTEEVPVVTLSSSPVATAPPEPTATPAATETAAATTTPAEPSPGDFIQAPEGKTLLIVANRSYANQPARLTLSGGESTASDQEIDLLPGQEVQIVLEPDFYNAIWSTPAHDNFTRVADFTAEEDQVVVMWIRPEEAVTRTEFHTRLARSGTLPTPEPTATPEPFMPGYEAPPGKALLVIANLTTENEFGQVTVAGGSFGGGQEIKIEPYARLTLELDPADDYRTVWTNPAAGGWTAGREFRASAGEVILGWIIPEDREVFMQFPSQQPEKISR